MIRVGYTLRGQFHNVDRFWAGCTGFALWGSRGKAGGSRSYAFLRRGL